MDYQTPTHSWAGSGSLSGIIYGIVTATHLQPIRTANLQPIHTIPLDPDIARSHKPRPHNGVAGVPWIINDLGIELMLVSARERGFEIDCWWRDEVALLEHWELAGYGESPAVVALSAGGLYAYVSVYRGSLTLIGLAPLIQPGKFEYDISELQAARATLTPFITQYTKRKDAAVPLEPLRPGDRIGGCALIGLEGLLGIAAEVDGLGRCTWVQLEADKPPVLASTVGLRWWKWNDRDAAFDHYWHEGRTRFSHYRAMQGALVGKQKALLKAFDKAPGRPAGRPAAVRSPDMPSKGGLPPGVYTMEDLKEYGRRARVCPYFAARLALRRVPVQ